MSNQPLMYQNERPTDLILKGSGRKKKKQDRYFIPKIFNLNYPSAHQSLQAAAIPNTPQWSCLGVCDRNQRGEKYNDVQKTRVPALVCQFDISTVRFQKLTVQA